MDRHRVMSTVGRRVGVSKRVALRRKGREALRRGRAWAGTVFAPQGLAGWQAASVLCVVVIVGTAVSSAAYHAVDRQMPAAVVASGPVDRILVDKSERRLQLLSSDQVLRTYRVALGANPVGHKEIEGDSRTPEGEYLVDWRLRDSEFHRALHISYPNEQDRRFAAAIRRSPGDSIMIHGEPNDLGRRERLARKRDWTGGCIAVSNRAIEEIWDAVSDGTPITIRP